MPATTKTMTATHACAALFFKDCTVAEDSEVARRRILFPCEVMVRSSAFAAGLPPVADVEAGVQAGLIVSLVQDAAGRCCRQPRCSRCPTRRRCGDRRCGSGRHHRGGLARRIGGRRGSMHCLKEGRSSCRPERRTPRIDPGRPGCPGRRRCPPTVWIPGHPEQGDHRRPPAVETVVTAQSGLTTSHSVTASVRSTRPYRLVARTWKE